MDVPCPPHGLSPADLLARADALRDGKEWAEAAGLYADYLRRNPGHWQIWVQYGHCTKECGDPETALLLYREAEKLQPADADAQLHLGHALKLLGRRDEACEAYARALSLEPANESARAELLAAAAVAEAPPPPDQEGEGPPAAAAAAAAAAGCVFDASDLLDYAQRDRAPTGIQRVQLNLIEHSLALGAAVAAFDPGGGAWKPVPRAVFERLAALSRSGAEPADPDWKDAVSDALDAVRRGPPLDFAPGGVLVTLGTAWWIPNYLLRVREAKARHGLRYVPMVYDCIPALLPEHCAAGLSSEFAAWFAGACVHADAMLAISDRTREDVLRLRGRLLPGADGVPVTVLPLHAGPLLPEPTAAPPPARRGPVLLLRSVRAAPGMDARGLRIVGAGGQVDTEFYNEWAAPPVELVEEAVRRWLAASGLFAAVVSPGSRLRPGLVLEAELLRLHAEPRAGLARAGLAALLLDEPREGAQARILGQFTPEGTAPLPGGARRDDKVPAGEAAAAMRDALAAALAALEGDLRGALRARR